MGGRTASTLDGVEQNANWKFNQAGRYTDAIQKIQDAGITVNGCFVLGLDNADKTSFDDVWDFVGRSGLYEVQITVMTAFPGTPLYDRLLRENRILKLEAWELCTLFDINYLPKADEGRRTQQWSPRSHSENLLRRCCK